MLYRKAYGQTSKLSFGAHVLMENRHGLCVAITVHNPIGQTEVRVALAQVDGHRQLHGVKVSTLGADKAYHQQKFVAGCRERSVSPHATLKQKVRVKGLDGRTTARSGYRRARKSASGWRKSLGG